MITVNLQVKPSFPKALGRNWVKPLVKWSSHMTSPCRLRMEGAMARVSSSSTWALSQEMAWTCKGYHGGKCDPRWGRGRVRVKTESKSADLASCFIFLSFRKSGSTCFLFLAALDGFLSLAELALFVCIWISLSVCLLGFFSPFQLNTPWLRWIQKRDISFTIEPR